MDEVPVVVGEDERAWEGMGDEEASDRVLFKTLISGGLTKSEALTAGVAKEVLSDDIEDLRAAVGLEGET